MKIRYALMDKESGMLLKVYCGAIVPVELATLKGLEAAMTRWLDLEEMSALGDWQTHDLEIHLVVQIDASECEG